MRLPTKGNGTGSLTRDAEIRSDDDRATLHLPKGTSVLDAQGMPVADISVDAGPACSGARERHLVRPEYRFRPLTARLDPPGWLTVQYDTLALALGADETTTRIGCFDEAKDEWVWLDSEVDLGAHSVSTTVSRLGVYIVSFAAFWRRVPF